MAPTVAGRPPGDQGPITLASPNGGAFFFAYRLMITVPTRQRGKRSGMYRKQQISNVLNNPSANPGLVLLLVKACTRYETDGTPLYRIERKA